MMKVYVASPAKTRPDALKRELDIIKRELGNSDGGSSFSVFFGNS